ncbi:hypothetical protein L208DRAFT_1275149 [Tricholoma matsutake]|nr:hypothetical protein L208DRAFT_1275149 [Tricholoma matsutake 945]
MSSNTATAILSLNNSKCPMVSAGTMTPELLHRFEHHTRRYLQNKEGLNPKNFVDHIVYSFEDALFSDWYQSQQELLSTLSFNNFMIKVRTRWLPKRWQQELARKVQSTKQNKTPFSDFIDSLRRDNLLLKGSQFHLSPSQLRTQIELNISPELAAAFDCWKDNHDSSDDEVNDVDNDVDADAAAAAKAAADALKAEARLQSFVDTLTKLDQKLIEDRTARKCDAEEAARSLKRSSSTPATNGHAQVSTLNSRPPKLTDHERKYLETYNGCKKCRGFYMPDGHPCEFPTGEGYVERSMMTVNDACKHIKLPALPVPRDEQTTTVNTVNMGSTSNAYNSAPPQPNTVPPALPVAAVLGISILGGGDSDLSCDSNDSVSTHVPFLSPHLVWECAVDSRDVSVPSRIDVSALIDHGSPAVLIESSWVSCLCLKTRALPSPFPVSGAFFDDKTASPTIALMHWVKLKLHDRNNYYSARTVRALIAPHLCHPIILGLPFLSHNNIVVDARKKTTIDSVSRFDLLHPSPPVIATMKFKLHDMKAQDKKNEVKNLRKLLIKELKQVCLARRLLVDARCIQVNGIDIFSTIRIRVEQLAANAELERLGIEVKKTYADVFKPIPHVNEMPDEVVCKIKLKDVSKTITTRSYSCPCKFREAWGILIQWHLDAGRIQPSSSAHASPAFLVLKADASDLPRWVNDYRQLNSNTVTDSHPLPHVDDILADAG